MSDASSTTTSDQTARHEFNRPGYRLVLEIYPIRPNAAVHITLSPQAPRSPTKSFRQYSIKPA